MVGIARPVSRPAFARPVFEMARVARRLFDEQQAQAPVPGAAIGVGARHHHQHTRLAGKGAPGLRAAQTPAARRGRGLERERADIGADIGFRHRDRAQHFARRQPRQPVRALRFGAAGEQRAAQDFGAGDQAARRAERGFRQRLGHHQHQQRGVGVGACVIPRAAAVALGDRQAEHAHLAQRLQQRFGNREVVAVDLRGHGCDELGAEAPKAVACEREGFALLDGRDARDVAPGGDDRSAGSGQRRGATAHTAQFGKGRRSAQRMQGRRIDPVFEEDGFQPWQAGVGRIGAEHIRELAVGCIGGQGGGLFQQRARSEQIGVDPGQFEAIDLLRIEPARIELAVDRAGIDQRAARRVESAVKLVENGQRRGVRHGLRFATRAKSGARFSWNAA